MPRPSEARLTLPRPDVPGWAGSPGTGAGLRDVMRGFATGVCLATTYRDRQGDRQHDVLTVNSLTSLSLDPPLVAVSLRRDSAFLEDLKDSGAWAVSILAGGDSDVARSCARGRAARRDLVHELPASPGSATGALVMHGSSWLECVTWASFDVGDHVLVVGEVVALNERGEDQALVFLHSRFHAVE
ncbi:flavin reductase domain protein FMN-binding protein [Cellulomonas flavigena DSM 20109]|uniref:Flavin reductase domain protein FMN-binding protein n=2 Tax=Cellulomonas flavigena TaxID=1711 RepID=D5UDP4_CELFN|nr:flavin reductase domain protein FMN-binding protein [Cellulomonas flavigena DSM 20109]